MKLVPIFVVQNTGIYAMWYTGEVFDEWNRLFDLWNDTEYLETFFAKHEKLITQSYFNGFTIEGAVQKTIDDAEKLERKLQLLAENAGESKTPDLESKFKMLNKNEYDFELVQHKAYGEHPLSWLRLYAIKIEPNVYVITGGAIKLTEKMHQLSETEKELIKLRNAVYFLKQEGILETDDLSDYFEMN
jgi:hypothetical protein